MFSLYRMRTDDGNEIRLSELYEDGWWNMTGEGRQPGKSAAAMSEFAAATRDFATATQKTPPRVVAGAALSRIRCAGFGGPLLVGGR